MPNYCENKINLSGDPEEVKKAFSFMASDSPLDFNKIIPYPKEFADKDKEFESLGWDAYKAKYGHIKDGFNSGGYEWCVKNWGTKWNAIEPVRDGNIIEFQSAWAPPIPVIAEIHKQNPHVGIKFSYNEPGMGFAGMHIYQPIAAPSDQGGTPTESYHWEDGEYTQLYPDHALSLAFGEALYKPENPSNHLTRDQLTPREEETAVAAVKELTTILTDGCFHTDTGPINEEGARSELSKLGNTLRVLIDDKFEPEIMEVISTVAAAGRAALIEKETSTMTSPKTDTEIKPTEDTGKKAGKKKTVVPPPEVLTLEEAKKKALDLALQLKDSGNEWMGTQILALTAHLNTDEDREEFMDYIGSTEFEEAVQELNPKFGELSDGALRDYLKSYHERLPYSRNQSESFVRFMADSMALTTAIGGIAGHLDARSMWNYLKDVRVPMYGEVLDRVGHFHFPEDARGKLAVDAGEGYVKQLRSWGKWNNIKELYSRPDQIPQELVDDMQSSLLRMVLGVDAYPRLMTAYSEKQFHVRDLIHNNTQAYQYSDVAKIWEAFLRTYSAVLAANQANNATVLGRNFSSQSIAEFLTTGRISSRLVNTIEEIEKYGWRYFATDRVFKAIELALEPRADAKGGTASDK